LWVITYRRSSRDLRFEKSKRVSHLVCTVGYSNKRRGRGGVFYDWVKGSVTVVGGFVKKRMEYLRERGGESPKPEL